MRQVCPYRALSTRVVDAGAVTSFASDRVGRMTRSPAQFGQRCANPAAHPAHHVHSNEQMYTSVAPGDRSRSQFSQFGRISSMFSTLAAPSRQLVL